MATEMDSILIVHHSTDWHNGDRNKWHNGHRNDSSSMALYQRNGWHYINEMVGTMASELSKIATPSLFVENKNAILAASTRQSFYKRLLVF